MILAGGGAFFFFRKQAKPKAASQRQLSHTGGQSASVQDRQGNWWYQDPNTGNWSFWNGQSWQVTPGSGPNLPAAAPPTLSSDRRPGGSSMLIYRRIAYYPGSTGFWWNFFGGT